MQDLAPKKCEKSAICNDIELKFGIETKFGPLSSTTNINLQFDVIMTFLAFWPFCLLKTQKWRDCDVIHQNFKNSKIEIKT